MVVKSAGAFLGAINLAVGQDVIGAFDTIGIKVAKFRIGLKESKEVDAVLSGLFIALCGNCEAGTKGGSGC